MLFGVVDQRYLARKPMVFTTNKKLRAWGDVLHYHDLAEVILDRVLERGQHIILRGSRSFRTHHLDPETLTSGGDAEPEGVRQSGNTPLPAHPERLCALRAPVRAAADAELASRPFEPLAPQQRVAARGFTAQQTLAEGQPLGPHSSWQRLDVLGVAPELGRLRLSRRCSGSASAG